MKPYFEKMADLGKALTEQQIKNAEGNVKQIREVEKIIAEAVDKVKKAGLTTEELNKRGEMTVYQRLEYLLDPGTWCPLHTLFDPMEEESGTTGVVDGLGLGHNPTAALITRGLAEMTRLASACGARRETLADDSEPASRDQLLDAAWPLGVAVRV